MLETIHNNKTREETFPPSTPPPLFFSEYVIPNDLQATIPLLRFHFNDNMKNQGRLPQPAAALPLRSTAGGSEKQKNAGEMLAGHVTQVCPAIRTLCIGARLTPDGWR